MIKLDDGSIQSLFHVTIGAAAFAAVLIALVLTDVTRTRRGMRKPLTTAPLVESPAVLHSTSSRTNGRAA